nr:spherulation-specific family 4 protein [Kibdelosporangium sp. MJ126-NF4]CEL18191.1 Phage-related protein, tail component [Kibdelosporangium sp. MJ126-NF4]
MATGLPGVSRQAGAATTTATTQQIAVPAYIHPGASPEDWNRLINAPSDKVGVIVANVLNGPDFARQDMFADVFSRAHGSGKRILGYVDTGYLGYTGQTTRLGWRGVADWISQVEQDINLWYGLYGDHLDGIFFDQGYNQCGTSANDTTIADAYKELNQYEKRFHVRGMTVLNPGAPVPQCYEDAADVLATFESSYEGYLGRHAGGGDLNYRDPGWTPRDPRKFWHIVYGVPADKVTEVIELSKTRNAGYVYVTDDVLSNPYDSVPGYWNAEFSAVSGGFATPAPPDKPPLGMPAPSALTGLRITHSTDYTSVGLSWNRSENAVGYYVFVNGHTVAYLPGLYTSATIGNLAPARKVRIFVAAKGRSGHASLPSQVLEHTTPDLPDGASLTEANSVAAGNNVDFSANFLIPYSFRRVFITAANSKAQPCWHTGAPEPRCALYVIENTTLLKYSGDETGTRWAWTPVMYLPPQVSGKNYKWSVPLDKIPGSNHLGSQVNAEGYGPISYLHTHEATIFGLKVSTILQGLDFLTTAIDLIKSKGKDPGSWAEMGLQVWEGWGNDLLGKSEADLNQALDSQTGYEQDDAQAIVEEESPKTPSQIAENKANGDAARHRLAKRYPGAIEEYDFATDQGVRRADLYVPSANQIVEAKVGRTGRSTDVRKQISKDKELLDKGKVTKIVWIFCISPKTRKVGPSVPLQNELTKNGIGWELEESS